MKRPWFVLCEGYHDRSFWQGLLADRFGLPREDVDDNRKRISQGQYGRRSRSGALIRLVPYLDVIDAANTKRRLEGRESMTTRATIVLDQRATDPINLVLCTDESDPEHLLLSSLLLLPAVLCAETEIVH